MNASPGQPHKLPDYWRRVLTWGAVSRGELDRQEEARGDVLRAACAGAGLVGDVGQERPGGAWTGLWLPSESLPWELGGVGGICSDSRPENPPKTKTRGQIGSMASRGRCSP